MPELPRRSISDLITMYSLEPTLADIYVEGSTDKALLEYLAGESEVHVVDVSVIDIPGHLLAEVGLTSGARQRVITLGIMLERGLGSSTYFIRCLIDADLDRFLNLESPTSGYQRMTDFSCLESYWFTASNLEKYRKLGLHDAGALKDIDLYDALADVAQDLFLLRAAAASLGESLAWVNPTSCCGRSGGGVVFDINEFVNRWLNSNRRFDLKEKLVEEVDRLRKQLLDDPRHYIHGHDLIEILSWFIKPYARPVQLANTEVVSRMLACCSERVELVTHPLLAELVTLGPAA